MQWEKAFLREQVDELDTSSSLRCRMIHLKIQLRRKKRETKIITRVRQINLNGQLN